MNVEPSSFEANGGTCHVQAPGSGDRLAGDCHRLVPVGLKAGNPMAQRAGVMRKKRFDVMDPEPRGLSRAEHDWERQQLAIGEDVGVDEGPPRNELAEETRQQPSSGWAKACRLRGDGMVQE